MPPLLDEDFDDFFMPSAGQSDEPDEQAWQFLALSRWGDKRVNGN